MASLSARAARLAAGSQTSARSQGALPRSFGERHDRRLDRGAAVVVSRVGVGLRGGRIGRVWARIGVGRFRPASAEVADLVVDPAAALPAAGTVLGADLAAVRAPAGHVALADAQVVQPAAGIVGLRRGGRRGVVTPVDDLEGRGRGVELRHGLDHAGVDRPRRRLCRLVRRLLRIGRRARRRFRHHEPVRGRRRGLWRCLAGVALAEGFGRQLAHAGGGQEGEGGDRDARELILLRRLAVATPMPAAPGRAAPHFAAGPVTSMAHLCPRAPGGM